MVAVLVEVDALPGAEIQFAVGNRDVQAHAHQRGFDVRWHVVSALRRVLPVPTLGCNLVHPRIKVGSHVRAAILVDRDGRARVLDEQVQQANFEFLQFGKVFEYRVGDQVATARHLRERNRLLYDSKHL